MRHLARLSLLLVSTCWPTEPPPPPPAPCPVTVCRPPHPTTPPDTIRQ